MKDFKLIIAGGRYFDNYNLLKQETDNFLDELFPATKDSNPLDDINIIIVSGTANGADSLGEQFAHEYQYTVKQFPADWAQHGKSAGYKRNAQMAEYADACIAFWDGESKGTKHMIDLAKTFKLNIKIVRY